MDGIQHSTVIRTANVVAVLYAAVVIVVPVFFVPVMLIAAEMAGTGYSGSEMGALSGPVSAACIRSWSGSCSTV